MREYIALVVSDEPSFVQWYFYDHLTEHQFDDQMLKELAMALRHEPQKASATIRELVHHWIKPDKHGDVYPISVVNRRLDMRDTVPTIGFGESERPWDLVTELLSNEHFILARTLLDELIEKGYE